MEELTVVIKCDYQEFTNRKDLVNVKIASGRERIGVMAFENVKTLESIIIPSGIKTIMTYAFRGCTNLAKIEMPSTVSKIDIKAFADCEKLENIDFLGTKAEWEKIEKSADYKDNSAIKKITCTDGVIEL